MHNINLSKLQMPARKDGIWFFNILHNLKILEMFSFFSTFKQKTETSTHVIILMGYSSHYN